jgi:hypothetical protein
MNSPCSEERIRRTMKSALPAKRHLELLRLLRVRGQMRVGDVSLILRFPRIRRAGTLTSWHLRGCSTALTEALSRSIKPAPQGRKRLDRLNAETRAWLDRKKPARIRIPCRLNRRVRRFQQIYWVSNCEPGGPRPAQSGISSQRASKPATCAGNQENRTTFICGSSRWSLFLFVHPSACTIESRPGTRVASELFQIDEIVLCRSFVCGA